MFRPISFTDSLGTWFACSSLSKFLLKPSVSLSDSPNTPLWLFSRLFKFDLLTKRKNYHKKKKKQQFYPVTGVFSSNNLFFPSKELEFDLLLAITYT